MDEFGGNRYDGSEEIFEDAITLYERVAQQRVEQRTLHSRIRIATDIENDIASLGPLGLFLRSQRTGALESLKSLVTIDPTSEQGRLEIVKEQGRVQAYLTVHEWALTMILDGDRASLEVQGDGVDEDEEGYVVD